MLRSTPASVNLSSCSQTKVIPVLRAQVAPQPSRQEAGQDDRPRQMPMQWSSNELSRRAMFTMAGIAVAVLPLQPAQAYQSNFLCGADTVSEEEDTECRRDALARDAGNKERQTAEYGNVVTKQKFEAAPNVPVANLDNEYYQATLKVSEEIEAYCALDVYDKQRIPLIKALKADGTTWVSKYARGGSARSQSARRMYIAVDSVVGHLASNGYAPLPKPKVKAVLKTITEAKDFLAKGI